ncbi:hypothetical protein AVEN_9931-1 [Araneus ventricosus]|uniref:Uncharacterized protein n=1 Tax=Araneus ventricosus TaxID=182803 RepID=A0A4Y2N6G5_ARAVE|nr:hypothetical protein AVEN_9931-1 [Araneus ventricosus]
MDEEFVKLFVMMAEMKAGLEKKIEAEQEEMLSGQDRLKQEMRSEQERKEEIDNQTLGIRSIMAVFKTQFEIVSSPNGWTDFVIASQLVASSREQRPRFFKEFQLIKLKDLKTIEKT